MPLNRTEIINKIQSQKKAVFIKSFEDEIILRKLPSGQVLDLTNKFSNQEITQEEFTFQMIVLSVVDETGNLVFSLEEVKDIPVDSLTEIAEEIAIYNGMNVEKAKNNLKKLQS